MNSSQPSTPTSSLFRDLEEKTNKTICRLNPDGHDWFVDVNNVLYKGNVVTGLTCANCGTSNVHGVHTVRIRNAPPACHLDSRGLG